MACDMEEVYSDSPRKMQDKEETTSEASWTAVTKGKEKEVWRLEPEGEAERPEATIPWNGVEGVSLNPECESRHWQVRAKTRGRKEKIKQTWKRWLMESHLVTRVRTIRVLKGKWFRWNLKKRRIM